MATAAITRQVLDEKELLACLATAGLKCVESYSEAWGPTTALQPTLRRFVTSLDPAQQDGGCFESLCCKAEGCRILAAHVSTSVPRFLLYRSGVLLATVESCNPPALLAALNAHVPRAGEPPEDQTVRASERGSQPLRALLSLPSSSPLRHGSPTHSWSLLLNLPVQLLPRRALAQQTCFASERRPLCLLGRRWRLLPPSTS
jgi:hypothetical protein